MPGDFSDMVITEIDKMNHIELECPICGKPCHGEILAGYPDFITTECTRDGLQAKRISRRRSIE